MKSLRTYLAVALLLLFGWYYSSINMFSHVHIVNGVSVSHSHMGGGTEHGHTDSQYLLIDLLSNFQIESAVPCITIEQPFFLLLSESCTSYEDALLLDKVSDVHYLRGPPQV